MTDSFPIKLGLFAKSFSLEGMPGAPSDRLFGYIADGLILPPGGSCYLAEFNPANDSQARIMAYADQYGRVFSCDDVLDMPPARTPDARIVLSPEGVKNQGAAYVVRDGREVLAGYFSCNAEHGIRGAKFTFVSVNFPGVFAVCENLSYHEMLATVHLSLGVFAAALERGQSGSAEGLAGSQGKALAGRASFNLNALYERLFTPDLFDAVNREVLEIEALQDDGAASPRGIECYFVRMLREGGLVGCSADDLAVSVDALEAAPASDASVAKGAAAAASEAQDATVAPVVRLVRTAAYADTYYVDFHYESSSDVVENGAMIAHPATAEARTKLLATEGALNRFLLLAEHFEGQDSSFDEDEGHCAATDLWLIDSICDQALDPSQPETPEGRWDAAMAFSRACESMRLPYRLTYLFRLSMAGDALAIEVVAPSVEVMPRSRWDREQRAFVPTTPADRNGTLARYVAHVAMLVAAAGFHVSAGIERVLVQCRRGDVSRDVVLTAAFDRADFCAAFKRESDAARDPFAFLSGLGARFSLGEDWRLDEVESLVGFDEGEFSFTYELAIHDDATVLSDEAAAMVGVRYAKDLNIFEDASRRKLAEEALAALDQGVEAAEARLKDIHDRTESLVVRRLCAGLLDGFALGTLDGQSYLEVREAFADPHGFHFPMMAARSLLRSGEDARAVSPLEELEASIGACKDFQDTKTACYRYFDSYATRAMYARHCPEDAEGRTVMPLPDEAYLVHDALAQVFSSSLANVDDAMRHAQRCVELAPSRAASYLRVARVHFMKADFEAEVRACCDALRVAWDPEDASLAWYWMAFAFWKMEKFDSAVASYRRCIMLGQSLAEQAKQELEELVDGVKGLQRRSLEDEDVLLEREGVPVGALRENNGFLLDLARACVNCDAVTLGCVLCASAQRVIRDDAIMPAIRALG